MSKAPAVDYALRIIEFMARAEGGVGISDILQELGINKNAASRVLEAFTEQGWIYLSDPALKKYSLTMKPFSVISKGITENAAVKIASPYLEKLNTELGDSVYYGIKNDDKVLYLLHFDSVREVRISGCVGGEYPLHSTAPGKVLMSCCDSGYIERYFDNIKADKAEKAITDVKAFCREAVQIKKRGYAVDNEEFSRGIICVACPVFDSLGNTVAAVGISTLTIYDNINSLINIKLPLLEEVALNISKSLGYEGNTLCTI